MLSSLPESEVNRVSAALVATRPSDWPGYDRSFESTSFLRLVPDSLLPRPYDYYPRCSMCFNQCVGRYFREHPSQEMYVDQSMSSIPELDLHFLCSRCCLFVATEIDIQSYIEENNRIEYSLEGSGPHADVHLETMKPAQTFAPLRSLSFDIMNLHELEIGLEFQIPIVIYACASVAPQELVPDFIRESSYPEVDLRDLELYVTSSPERQQLAALMRIFRDTGMTTLAACSRLTHLGSIHVEEAEAGRGRRLFAAVGSRGRSRVHQELVLVGVRPELVGVAADEDVHV